MGFKDANWAYSVPGLPMAQKVVLAAICQRTDDKTHTTLVGQETIARMIGASVDTVRRSVGALEDLGILTRTKRHRPNCARNSELRCDHGGCHLHRRQPTRRRANKADRGNLPDSVQQPTQQSAGGNGVNQKVNQI